MASPARRGSSVRNDDELVYLTLDETKALFAELVRDEVGISVEEFFRRYDAGELRDSEAPELRGAFMWHRYFDMLRP